MVVRKLGGAGNSRVSKMSDRFCALRIDTDRFRGSRGVLVVLLVSCSVTWLALIYLVNGRMRAPCRAGRLDRKQDVDHDDRTRVARHPGGPKGLLLIFFQKHQIVGHHIAYMKVDYPIH